MAFKYVDDLASVWCEWAEMELQHKQFKRALELMRRATAAPITFDRRRVRLWSGLPGLNCLECICSTGSACGVL